jgi:hypothetical protein
MNGVLSRVVVMAAALQWYDFAAAGACCGVLSTAAAVAAGVGALDCGQLWQQQVWWTVCAVVAGLAWVLGGGSGCRAVSTREAAAHDRAGSMGWHTELRKACMPLPTRAYTV